MSPLLNIPSSLSEAGEYHQVQYKPCASDPSATRDDLHIYSPPPNRSILQVLLYCSITMFERRHQICMFWSLLYRSTKNPTRELRPLEGKNFSFERHCLLVMYLETGSAQLLLSTMPGASPCSHDCLSWGDFSLYESCRYLVTSIRCMQGYTCYLCIDSMGAYVWSCDVPSCTRQ